MIRVLDARFVGGAATVGRYPGRIDPAVGTAPEVAFAGRSNVGKSSLINCLAGRKRLAHTSTTPGRTRQLNFYVLSLSREDLVFVDLPGYGYARVSQGERSSWGPLVEGFLESRATLRGVVLIVDVRRGLGGEEHELLDWLRTHRQRVVVAATKVDLLPRGRRAVAVRALESDTGDVPLLGVSARTGDGRQQLWRRILAMVR